MNGNGSATTGYAAPGTYPVPPGRGRWRVLVLGRPFASASWGELALAEVADARGRRLEKKWNEPATFTFTVEGHSPAAKLIIELQTDILALRWDGQTGTDVPVFRGVVTHGHDQLTEQAHVVTFTAKDYAAVLHARLLYTTWTWNQTDQDTIAGQLGYALPSTVRPSGGGAPFTPGANLPFAVTRVYSDGSTRAPLSGVLRDRTYPAGTVLGEAFENLAQVDGGFDWDVQPFGAGNNDSLRIFYPYQGITRDSPALVYGSTVSTVDRTVNSADYGNYVRVIGNNGSSDPAAPQLYAERWNADVNDVTRIPVGPWQRTVNASDVTLQATLNEQAAGQLALMGVLTPSYTLGLRPDTYSYGNPNIGDVVPVRIESGRLDVATTIRVLGIDFDIGDDGQEDVSLTVGRPAETLPHMITAASRDIDALARR